MSAVVSRKVDEVMLEVGRGLCLAADRSGREFSPTEIQEWCTAFAECEPLQLRQAFENATLASTFQPTIATIRRELDRMHFGGVSGAWLRVQKTAIECFAHGGNWLVVFEHPAIHFAIEALGGWERMKDLVRDRKQQIFARRDFVQAFEDYRPPHAYPAGLGTFNGHNVILVGNRVRAMEVYRGGVRPGRSVVPGLEALQREALSPWEQPVAWPDKLCATHLAKVGRGVYEPPPWLAELPELPSCSTAGQ